MKLLVLDDERVELSLYQEYLRGSGVEVELYTSPTHALEALKDHGYEFGLAIVDLMMPQMSGIEFMVAARRIRPELPFVVMSCLPQWSAKELAFSAGAMLYVEKPVVFEEYKALLRRVLKALGKEEKPDEP